MDGADFYYMLGLEWARTRRGLAMIGAPEVNFERFTLEDDLRDVAWHVLVAVGLKSSKLTDLLPRIEHDYWSTFTGVRSWNSDRMYLIRVQLMMDEEADRIVAATVDETIRRRRAALR